MITRSRADRGVAKHLCWLDPVQQAAPRLYKLTQEITSLTAPAPRWPCTNDSQAHHALQTLSGSHWCQWSGYQLGSGPGPICISDHEKSETSPPKIISCMFFLIPVQVLCPFFYLVVSVVVRILFPFYVLQIYFIFQFVASLFLQDVFWWTEVLTSNMADLSIFYFTVSIF